MDDAGSERGSPALEQARLERQRAAQLILRDALDRPVEDRSAYVASACADDRSLQEEVQALLAALDASDGFLESPPVRSGALSALASEDLAGSPSLVGRTIGPFAIESVLGSGGMGTVYVARQERPDRTVALKVMRSGLSDSALRRFEYEADVLGRLHHPCVAQIYEVGTARVDDEARPVPYFAMEHLPGAQPITRHALEHDLDLAQRLELMAQVCDGVHHGHQRGVIHRDLKPANILIDAEGRPRIIDFGVARAVDPDPAATLRTSAGELVGTLGYMSPEQCAGDPDAVDTRSDVYALGVVLYELACGRPPHEVRSGDLYMVMRAIREQPPTRPGVIRRSLRGDLETIILSAIEKNPDRRYASAAALAGDLRRYLAHEPIEARPASWLYHARMLVRRHRALATIGATAVLALLIATAVSVRFARAAVAEAYAATIAAAGGELQMGEYRRMRDRLERAPSRLRDWEWRYFMRRAQPSVATYFGHTHMVSDVAASPDGAWLASGARDGSVRIWDARSGAVRWTLLGHDAEVWGVAFAPDGRTVISCGAAGTIRRWDLATGTETDCWRDHDGWTWDIALSPDGSLLASVGVDGVLTVREIVEGRVRRWSTESVLHAVHFSPDGRSVATAGADGSVRLWDVRGVEAPRVLGHHGGAARHVRFDATGERLASCGEDRSVRVWHLRADAPPMVVPVADTTFAAAWSPDGRELATAEGRFVQVRDAGTGAVRATLGGHEELVGAIAFAPDGRRIYTSSWDETLRAWNPGGIDALDVLRGHAAAVLSVAFSPDGARLASGDESGELRVWDAVRGCTLASFTDHDDGVTAVAFNPDGRRLLTGSRDGTLVLRRSDTGTMIARLAEHESDVAAAAFSPDGTLIASGSWDGTVILWDGTDGRMVERLVGHRDTVRSLAFAPDGRTLVTGSWDQSVRTWNLEARRIEHELVGHTFQVYAVAVSPGGSRIISGSRDREIRTWDARTGRGLQVDRGHGEWVSALAFTADGSRLVSSSRHGTVRVRDARSMAILATLGGHTDDVWGVAFSPDGTRLASASSDRTVRLWDTVPVRDRLAQREMEDAAQAPARAVVDRMEAEDPDPDRIAEKLRAGSGIDPALRWAALNELLHRTAARQ